MPLSSESWHPAQGLVRHRHSIEAGGTRHLDAWVPCRELQPAPLRGVEGEGIDSPPCPPPAALQRSRNEVRQEMHTVPGTGGNEPQLARKQARELIPPKQEAGGRRGRSFLRGRGERAPLLDVAARLQLRPGPCSQRLLSSGFNQRPPGAC